MCYITSNTQAVIFGDICHLLLTLMESEKILQYLYQHFYGNKVIFYNRVKNNLISKQAGPRHSRLFHITLANIELTCYCYHSLLAEA